MGGYIPPSKAPPPPPRRINANDEINKPSHYMIFPDMEVIDIIRKTLTPEEFKGYCKGNSLKYRLRAGAKGPAETCIAKAKVYEGWLSAPMPLPELWYPDDSGEWVEVEQGSGIPKGVGINQWVEVLIEDERERKDYSTEHLKAKEAEWNSNDIDGVVAYKKVTP